MNSTAKQIKERYQVLTGQTLTAEPKAVRERAEALSATLAQAKATPASEPNAPENRPK